MYNLKKGYMGEVAAKRAGGYGSFQNNFDSGRNTGAATRRQSNVEALPARLLSNYLLASQSNNEFAKILPFLERITFSEDEYIYQPGDDIDFVYFPESAVISEFLILEDGRTVEIAMTGREGMFGISTFFNSETAANWSQVSVPGSALKINTRILKEEINRGGAFQALLFNYINDYISQISQRVVCNSHHTLNERFCSWLLMLQDRKKSDKLSITQEQIARCLGVHRPSVTQIAQSLRRKKIINYARGKLFILDRQKLEESACDCYQAIKQNSSAPYLS